MSKTVWGDGSHITPSLMDAYWGSDGNTGHSHDGLDSDGSVPKVALDSEVSGTLPGTNIQAPLPLANITHTHGSGGMPVVAIDGGTDYTTGKFTVHLDSIDGALHAEDTTWAFTKIGNLCHLRWPAVYGVDTTDNTFKVSPGSQGPGTWPTAVVPSEDQFLNAGMVSVIITEQSDSQFRPGLLYIGNGVSDQWDFYVTDQTCGQWITTGFGLQANPGLKGLMGGGCSYMTDAD